MNKYDIVGLYEHNIESYEKIKEAFIWDDSVAIVHATGTGKSYNALQLAYDNPDKKIVYVVSSKGIIEHIKKIIDSNSKIDINSFSNVEFRTYQSFINLNREEMENIECDLLILDEFHHLGAPIWGARINTFIETHPGIKKLGMTAYTIRDRGTSYERDMANPDGEELFSNKVVSRYDLCDAIIDGVLPKPIYKSAYVNLMDSVTNLEERVKKLDTNSKEYQELLEVLKDIKRRIQEAPSISDVVKRNIKKNGKYIYFCPPLSEDGVNDIDTIVREARTWFLEMGLNEEDIVFYQTTSKMGEDGLRNREAFYNDVSLNGKNTDGKLRVMFAINQYNEGIHAPNVDGVIMGRGTTSDIVYFEQLGRALSVRGETKEKYLEYEKYSKEELIKICHNRDILVNEDISKEELIEKLIAPIIIDLTNNFEFISELENNLKDRVKLEKSKGPGNKRNIKIGDASFDIEMVNRDLFLMLSQVRERLTMTWEDYYELARAYYEHHGDLDVSYRFRTNNGYQYDENGIVKLGVWVFMQRSRENSKSERGKMLSHIGMRWDKVTLTWERMYEYAKMYYEHHGNLEIPEKFKTNNGYDYDEKGNVKLGVWIIIQRYKESRESERGKKLSQIGMRWKSKKLTWESMYECAKIYYEHYGNLEVKYNFRTNNGYEYDENGKIGLGAWIYNQRQKVNAKSECGILLSQIGMRWNRVNLVWESMYEYAKIYYEYHNNLEIPNKFKTNNGYEYAENGKIGLGQWIAIQRREEEPSSDRGKLLSQIGMRWENKKLTWESMYEYAKKYFEHYGDLEVKYNFRTNNGYEYNENGKIDLGKWIIKQRGLILIDSEKGQKLSQIGMNWESKYLSWEEIYKYAKIYYQHYGNLETKRTFKTNNGYDYDENGEIKLGTWIFNQRTTLNPNSEKGKKLSQIGMRWDNKRTMLPWENIYEYAKIYYEYYGNLEVKYKFRTNNGYEYAETGKIKLGEWIKAQRRNVSPNSERGKKLSQIGMVWNAKKNSSDRENVCYLYRILTEKNKTILEHISVQELTSKISYLNEMNIPIVYESGILHEIFSMSSKSMKEIYGVSLEELIDKYYISRNRGKK